MAAALSKQAFGREAGCSRQAVAKAIGAGHLIAGRDGKLDPAEPQNAVWIARRNLGLSGDGLRMQHPEKVWAGEAGVAEPAEGVLFSNWDAAPFDPRKADQLLAETCQIAQEGGAVVAYLCGMLEALRAATAAQLERQAAAIEQLQAEVARLTGSVLI